MRRSNEGHDMRAGCHRGAIIGDWLESSVLAREERYITLGSALCLFSIGKVDEARQERSSFIPKLRECMLRYRDSQNAYITLLTYLTLSIHRSTLFHVAKPLHSISHFISR